MRFATRLFGSRWGHAHPNHRASCATTTGVRTEFGRSELSILANTETATVASILVSTGDARGIELTWKESQVIVFARRKGEQVTLENPKFSHDAFARALIEGLGEKWRADPYKLGHVTYKGLDARISARISVQTQKKQTPRLMAPPGGIDDFPFASK